MRSLGPSRTFRGMRVEVPHCDHIAQDPTASYSQAALYLTQAHRYGRQLILTFTDIRNILSTPTVRNVTNSQAEQPAVKSFAGREASAARNRHRRRCEVICDPRYGKVSRIGSSGYRAQPQHLTRDILPTSSGNFRLSDRPRLDSGPRGQQRTQRSRNSSRQSCGRPG